MPSLNNPPKLVNRGPAGLLAKDGGKLTNRGAAGLVAKKPAPKTAALPVPTRPPKGPLNRIRCQGEVVAIDSLTPDPNNARLHPERNIESVEDSLNLYGQMMALLVRRRDRMVVAGNGRLEAAKRLGWTKIAVNFQDMTDVEAAGYGLADNRTAEHARWDFEVVARLDRLMQEAGQHQIGWSLDELEVLRAADWTPPAITDEEYNQNGDQAQERQCPSCGHKWSE